MTKKKKGKAFLLIWELHQEPTDVLLLPMKQMKIRRRKNPLTLKRKGNPTDVVNLVPNENIHSLLFYLSFYFGSILATAGQA